MLKTSQMKTHYKFCWPKKFVRSVCTQCKKDYFDVMVQNCLISWFSSGIFIYISSFNCDRSCIVVCKIRRNRKRMRNTHKIPFTWRRLVCICTYGKILMMSQPWMAYLLVKESRQKQNYRNWGKCATQPWMSLLSPFPQILVSVAISFYAEICN